MDKPPRPKNKRLLDLPLLLRAYCFLGPLEALVSMAGFFFVYWQAGWRPGMEMAPSGPVYVAATTMAFAGIVASQIGNVQACRTERESVFTIGLFGNRLVIAGIAAEIAILLLLLYTPLLQEIFGLAPLRAGDWIFLIVFMPLLLILEEARKYIMRSRPAAKVANVP